ncbi:coiled-coil domain-containing protein 18-like isoform X2 [Ostrea edulis]|uniref:coiled-coil domain-containing protein 18-like isoform X2 n=1 Tax=Ostrea edulis TaxID=37623 RepID=UPI0024AF6CCE|nr:coiled-coil domain-containing protein 18-like isoform X2 [Ostrea edulis]
MEDCEPQELLMQNVQDLRKRLADTERNLKKLSKIEKQGNYDDSDVESISTLNSVPVTERFVMTMDDLIRNPLHHDVSCDRDSIRSGLATLPESSYAGFERIQHASSTPNKPQAPSRLDRYNRVQLMERGSQQESGEIRYMKEANKKLLQQNHKLLEEMERYSQELNAAKSKVQELSLELDDYRQSLPDLEDKIVGLQGETDSQDKALREAEERYEKLQRQNADYQLQIKQTEQEIEELRTDLSDEKKKRKGAEVQRDEALQNFIEAQETLEDYQKKAKDKTRKLENNEDYLRDSLGEANQEREDLLERISLLQAKIKSQNEEIRRLQLLEEVELDSRRDLEKQNTELKSSLSKNSSKLSRLETDSLQMESLKKENSRLQSQVDHQREQLSVCQQEIEESRTMLSQLEQLAQQVQNQNKSQSRGASFNDSGVYSVSVRAVADSSRGQSHDMGLPTFYKSGGAEYGASEQVSTAPGGARAILQDLRMQLAMKDAEIQRLQSCLQSQEASSQTVLIESLRQELTSMLENKHQGAHRVQELEMLVSQYEADKSRLVGEITELKREIGDREAQNSSFETRITQRNSQLIELQEQINHKCSEISNLEREVRKKSSQIHQLEEQLDEKSAEFSNCVSRIKQLEHDVTFRDEEITRTQVELKEKQQSLHQLKSTGDKNQQLHQEQCRDYEKQIDMIQKEMENKSSVFEENSTQLTHYKRELEGRNSQVKKLQKELDKTKEKLEVQTQQSHFALRQLESQANEGTSQMKQLEAALFQCKEEVKTYLGALEESRDKYDRDIRHKEEMVNKMERHIKQIQKALEDKYQENINLEKTVFEHQTMLQQSTTRIAELEDIQSELGKQVSQLEHQLLTQKAQAMTESQMTEKKLKQACEDLEHRTVTINKLTDALRELEVEKKNMNEEINMLEQQLQDEQEGNDDKVKRMSKLEKDIRDLRVQLEQKIEIVNDYEDQIQKKTEDMDQQTQLVSDLDSEVKRLQVSQKQAIEQSEDTSDKLQKVVRENQAKEEMIEDMKDTLRKTQEELNEKRHEVHELSEAIEDRQRELQQRTSQVNELSATVKEQHTEMKQRIMTLESSLQKYELEIQERTKQIAELDDKLQQTQSQLGEMTLQYRHADQQCKKQSLELQSKTAKLQELEKTVERHHFKLEEQKDENVEVTQELRLTREQLQQQHKEFLSTRRQLAQVNRENERLTREMEEINIVRQTRETDTARLEEELGATKAREIQAETRLNAEIRLRSEEMERAREEHQVLVDELQRSISHLSEDKEKIERELEKKMIQIKELEIHYQAQFDILQKELENIQDEMIAKKELASVANESLIIKDSEIARLRAKISGMERTMASLNMSNNNNSESVYQSSMIGAEVVKRRQGSENQSEVDSQESRSAPVSPAARRRILKEPYSTAGKLHGEFHEPEDDTALYMLPVPRDVKSGESKRTQQVHFKDGDTDEFDEVLNEEEVKWVKSNLGRNNAVSKTPLRSKGVPRASDRINNKDFRNLAAQKGKGRKSDHLPGEFEIEPMTAVRMYKSPHYTEQGKVDTDSAHGIYELQEKLRANEMRQKLIDQQLKHLDDGAIHS